MSDIVISVDEGERGPRVVLTGDLDLPAGDALEALVTPMIGPDREVEIDLRGVQVVDSSGLGALLALSQLARESGGELVLRSPSPAVRATIDLTQTAGMFRLAS